ncbi:MAG: ABC transporter permease subunit [Pseudomonadota bacterium]
MLRYALSRLASAVPTLLLVLILAFALVHAAPGGPFDTERVLAPEVQARLQAAYGLDQPQWRQFLNYLGGLLRGDFGPSYRYPQSSVGELIADAFPVSASLGLLALVFGVAIGVLAGTMAALRQNRFVDHAVMTVSMTGISVPSFVIAPLLVLLFAVTLRWLPASGLQSPQHYVLPVFALALPMVAYIARLMRASMLEVLKSQFIRTARSQGLTRTTLVFRYAMKPALIPVISYLGPAIAAVLTGSVVIEQIFNLPGIGRLFIQGALNRDYTLVMGLVVLYSTLLISLNLLVDLVYGYLDPRVRYA